MIIYAYGYVEEIFKKTQKKHQLLSKRNGNILSVDKGLGVGYSGDAELKGCGTEGVGSSFDWGVGGFRNWELGSSRDLEASLEIEGLEGSWGWGFGGSGH